MREKWGFLAVVFNGVGITAEVQHCMQKIPTSAKSRQKWGTRVRWFIRNLGYTPTGSAFVASNWRNTYCKIPPLA